jgi:hypothetical protein
MGQCFSPLPLCPSRRLGLLVALSADTDPHWQHGMRPQRLLDDRQVLGHPVGDPAVRRFQPERFPLFLVLI